MSLKEKKLLKQEAKEQKKRHKEFVASATYSKDELAYMRKKNMKEAIWPVFRFILIFGLAFVILYPLIFMVTTAFRPSDQMNDPSIKWITRTYTFQNVIDVFNAMDYSKTVLTTIRYNLISSILQVATCAITGYGFARFNFKGKGLLFGIVIMMILVPPQITIIPTYLQFVKFDPLGLVSLIKGSPGIIDTGWSLYLPALFANGLRAGLFIFLFRQFFRGLPKELEDAAYLDGCGPLKTFVKVMAPNASSSFLTVFLFSIVWYWNDYFISTSFFTEKSTISLMLQNLNQQLITQIFGPGANVPTRELIVWLEAGCIISILPILIMYIVLQRYFTEGIAKSGIVG